MNMQEIEQEALSEFKERTDKVGEFLMKAGREPHGDGLLGIATLSHDPLATYHLHGSRPQKVRGRRK